MTAPGQRSEGRNLSLPLGAPSRESAVRGSVKKGWKKRQQIHRQIRLRPLLEQEWRTDVAYLRHYCSDAPTSEELERATRTPPLFNTRAPTYPLLFLIQREH